MRRLPQKGSLFFLSYSRARHLRYQNQPVERKQNLRSNEAGIGSLPLAILHPKNEIRRKHDFELQYVNLYTYN